MIQKVCCHNFIKNTLTINNYNQLIIEFIRQYENEPCPIQVNFRKIIPTLNNADRTTHLIHRYPAKLLMHIPFVFLNNSILSTKGSNVLDPFCGSGTVLLESIIAKKNAFGVDANPLARLISSVKTTLINVKKANNYLKYVLNFQNTESAFKYPKVVNINYWFLPHIKEQLNTLLISINTIEDIKYRNFFLVCFSNVVSKVSLADTRVSVPVKIKPENFSIDHPLREKAHERIANLKTLDVKTLFQDIVRENIKRFQNLKVLINGTPVSQIISDDAKKIIKPVNNLFSGISEESIDLIITSPPYVGAQKYIRATSLNLGWTNLTAESELKELDRLSIGRENYSRSDYNSLVNTGIKLADDLLTEIYHLNPLRAHIAGNYLIEMKEALQESIRTLKKGGFLVLIIGNNQVCGKEFNTQKYLTNILENLGLKVLFCLIDDIKSYGLMTKRNKTASIISNEWVILFQK